MSAGSPKDRSSEKTLLAFCRTITGNAEQEARFQRLSGKTPAEFIAELEPEIKVGQVWAGATRAIRVVAVEDDHVRGELLTRCRGVVSGPPVGRTVFLSMERLWDYYRLVR